MLSNLLISSEYTSFPKVTTFQIGNKSILYMMRIKIKHARDNTKMNYTEQDLQYTLYPLVLFLVEVLFNHHC